MNKFLFYNTMTVFQVPLQPLSNKADHLPNFIIFEKKSGIIR